MGLEYCQSILVPCRMKSMQGRLPLMLSEPWPLLCLVKDLRSFSSRCRFSSAISRDWAVAFASNVFCTSLAGDYEQFKHRNSESLRRRAVIKSDLSVSKGCGESWCRCGLCCTISRWLLGRCAIMKGRRSGEMQMPCSRISLMGSPHSRLFFVWLSWQVGVRPRFLL